MGARSGSPPVCAPCHVEDDAQHWWWVGELWSQGAPWVQWPHSQPHPSQLCNHTPKLIPAALGALPHPYTLWGRGCKEQCLPLFWKTESELSCTHPVPTVSATAFYKAQPVIEFMCEVLDIRNIDEQPKASRTSACALHQGDQGWGIWPGGEGNQCSFRVRFTKEIKRVRTQPGGEGNQCLLSSLVLKKEIPLGYIQARGQAWAHEQPFQLWQAVCVSQAWRWKWPTVDKWRGNTACVRYPPVLQAIRRKLMGLLVATTGGRGPPGRYFNILRSHSDPPPGPWGWALCLKINYRNLASLSPNIPRSIDRDCPFTIFTSWLPTFPSWTFTVEQVSLPGFFISSINVRISLNLLLKQAEILG